MSRRVVLLSAALVTAACGGGGGGGITQPPPVTTPPGASVAVVVYYDENGNGLMDANEQARLPQVEVTVGGRTARTETLSGRAVVQGVPGGVHAVAINPTTLPPFYTAGASGATVTVPPDATASPIPLPARLEIGGNRTNVYMAFGDSITKGEGDSSPAGYPGRLQTKLRAHFGDGEVVNRGADGTNSGEAVERLLRNLRPNQPAFTLVLYGTNDWNQVECHDTPPCEVVANLRRVLFEVKNADSLPFLATLPPVNPVLAGDGRNRWIEQTNVAIKQLAREQGAFVVDLYEAFRLQGGDVSRFFTDHVHPNAAGYDVMAEAFFQAIALGREAPRASSRMPVLFARPR
jgi:lysophospholipase L1-like esterase